jgi:hypothetical protein
METGRETQSNTFYVNGRPRPFLSLRTNGDGTLRIINDERAAAVQIAHGLYCGLQNSVIRRSVFAEQRFWPDYLVVEDELFVIRMLAEGKRFGYFDAPHVLYRVHRENSSGSAASVDAQRNVRIFGEMVRGFERIRAEVFLPRAAARSLSRRLAKERFWGLGYSGYWMEGNTVAALSCYRTALAEWPWSAQMWKTYLLACFGLSRSR